MRLRARQRAARDERTDVWAIGECAGSPQFTHASEDDFRIIRDNLAGGTRSTRDRLMPYCMFTDPPLARVGLSEADAQRQGLDVRVARLPISAVLPAQRTGEKQGFMKALVGARDDLIIGFTMIGAEAGEVVATTVQNGDAGRATVFPTARCGHRASDDGGRTWPAVFKCATSAASSGAMTCE